MRYCAIFFAFAIMALSTTGVNASVVSFELNNSALYVDTNGYLLLSADVVGPEPSWADGIAEMTYQGYDGDSAAWLSMMGYTSTGSDILAGYSPPLNPYVLTASYTYWDGVVLSDSTPVTVGDPIDLDVTVSATAGPIAVGDTLSLQADVTHKYGEQIERYLEVAWDIDFDGIMDVVDTNVGAGRIENSISYHDLVNTYGLSNGVHEAAVWIEAVWLDFSMGMEEPPLENYSSGWGKTQFEIVPEPATLGLFALGGLGLLRRKTKNKTS